MSKVAIVTGGSSGIGKCTAAALRDAGCIVYELSRRESVMEGVHHITADVTDETGIKEVVGRIVEKEGRIDLVVNNAGFGISGAAEFTENENAKRLLEVNLFGVVNLSKAVIPIMRKQQSGRIVNLSSVAAVAPIPFQAWYSVTKASVNSYTLALANELRPFGISICAVMPGDIKTGFTSAREKFHLGDDIYEGRISGSVAKMEQDEQTGMEPLDAAAMLCRIALRKSCKPLVTLGLSYKLICVCMKFLPTALVNRLLGALYAK